MLDVAVITSSFPSQRRAGDGDPAGRSATEDRKAQLVEELTKWAAAAKEARASASMAPEDLGQLNSLDRLLVTRYGLLEDQRRYLQENPQADMTLALLTLITVLSDNRNGFCNLGAKRIGQFFLRHPSRVLEAMTRLEQAGCIGVEAEPGKETRSWPIVNPAVGRRDQITWLVDAHSRAPAPRGRPRKTPPTGAVPFSEKPPLRAGGVSTDAMKNPRCLTQKPPLPASEKSPAFSFENANDCRRFGPNNQTASGGESTRDTTQEDEEEEREALARGDQFPRSLEKSCADLAFKWTGRNGFEVLEFLNGTAEALQQTFPRNIIEAALKPALLATSATIQDGISQPKVSAFCNYLTAAWRSNCEGLRDQCQDAETKTKIASVKVEAEHKIAAQRSAAFEEARAPRPSRGTRGQSRGARDDAGRVFEPGAKLGVIHYSSLTGAHGNIMLEEVPGASTVHVTKAIMKAAAYLSAADFPKKKGGPDVNDVMGRCVVELAHIVHGTPEQRFGNAGTLGGTSLSCDWAVITSDEIDALRAAHPDAFVGEADLDLGDDESCMNEIARHDFDWRVRDAWGAVKKIAHEQRHLYGTGDLQGVAEKEFQRRFVEGPDKNTPEAAQRKYERDLVLAQAMSLAR